MAQQQNAHVHTHWTMSGGSGYWDIEQEVWIGTVAASTYWALSWKWVASSFGGYIGLQYREDGSTTALFSLWDHENPSPVTGDNNGDPAVSCAPFGGEGTGWRCHRSSPSISTDRNYRYRVTRLDHAEPADNVPSDSANAQWWGAWIYDTETGERFDLGLIKAPADNLSIATPMNFVEYFGSAVPAPEDVPVSVAYWEPLAANILDRSTYGYEHISTLDPGRTNIGKGTTGWTEPWSFPIGIGQRVIQGGSTSTPPASNLSTQHI